MNLADQIISPGSHRFRIEIDVCAGDGWDYSDAVSAAWEALSGLQQPIIELIQDPDEVEHLQFEKNLSTGVVKQYSP